MTESPRTRLTAIVLALLTLGGIIFGGLNFVQRYQYQAPDDGVAWQDSADGVMAAVVKPNGPADRAGIRPGDRIVAINGFAVRRATQVTRHIFRLGSWAQARYSMMRGLPAQAGQAPFEVAVVLTPPDTSFSLEHYLRVVGLLYLFIGLFIFARRWNAPKAVHFYIFCLISFVFYAFHYSRKLNPFDWIIYWGNVTGMLLQPAVFLHFALTFPERRRSWPQRLRLGLVYLPAALLLLLHVAVASQWLGWMMPSVAARDLLDRMEFIYLGLLFLIGAMVLAQTYRRAESVVLKQQMKWLTRGTFLSILPFLVCYIIPYFMGWPIRPWMKLSALSLILLPLTFGYAIVRYRLMDVDIIFKRGVAYTLATAAIVGLYFGVIAALGALFQTSVQGGPWSAVIAIIIGAILFQPVRDWFQARIDRFFYRDRYDYRRTLIEFGRTLSSEVNLERMLGSVLDRLSQTLLVDRMAIFLPDRENGGFRLIRSFGLNYREPLALTFLGANKDTDRSYLFYETLRNEAELSPEARRSLDQLDLHYYIPCRLQKRTVAFLGLGKTVDGDFLSTEDIELLQTIAGYVAIAVENAELYQSLEQKARQIEQLKDFSENIIESVNVGLLAVNLEGRIESWNPRMEQLYGLSRSEAVGRRLEEVFPAELVGELTFRQGDPAAAGRGADQAPRSTTLYKFYLENWRKERLVVNLGLAPLRDKSGQVEGSLIIVDDMSQRVQFEQQLMQAEKLTSIGLLAAGVAHEVNTPLAVISNYVQMLAKQMDRNDPRLKLIEKIVQQTFRASEIVNNLLSFSRTSGTQLAEVDVNQLIEDTLGLLDHQFKTGQVSVLKYLQPQLPPIHGNNGKLQQVFLNLFLNAKDAMPNGGVLEVRTTARDSIVEIEVNDNGVGIPREHLHKIFDPFFTTKSNFRGTGLGLAVSYGIVREHAGKIDVSSAPGRGTSFRLEFPVPKHRERKAARVSG